MRMRKTLQETDALDRIKRVSKAVNELVKEGKLRVVGTRNGQPVYALVEEVDDHSIIAFEKPSKAPER